jgi:hypothetical protein
MQQFRQIRYDYSETTLQQIDAASQNEIYGLWIPASARHVCMLQNGLMEEAAAVYEITEPHLRLGDGETKTNVLLWKNKSVAHCPCQIGTGYKSGYLCRHIAVALKQLRADEEAEANRLAEAPEIARLDAEAERDYKKRQHDKILLAEITHGMSFSRKIAAENQLKFLKAWHERRSKKLPF